MRDSIKKLNDLKINLHRHRSPISLISAYYSIKDKKLSEYSNTKEKKTFLSRKSDIYGKNMSIAEVIEETKIRGLWGFCELNLGNNIRQIHYWYDKNKVEICDIGELLCHEVAHAIGIKGEMGAIKYGYVCSIVIQFLLRDILKNS